MQSHAVSVSCSGYLLIPFDGSGKYQRVAVGLAMRLGNAVTRPALRGVLTSRMQGRRGQLFCGGLALEPKLQIRRQEVNDRHVERLRHVCAKRGVRMRFERAVWTFLGNGIDLVAVDLRAVTEEDLAPSHHAA